MSIVTIPLKGELIKLVLTGTFQLSFVRCATGTTAFLTTPLTEDARAAYTLFGPEERAPSKIGYAKDVLSRVYTLRTGSPTPLLVLAIFPGSSREERETHIAFTHSRYNLEWFHFDGVELNRALKYFKERGGFVLQLSESERRNLGLPVHSSQGLPRLIKCPKESNILGKNKQLYCESFVM